MTLDALYQQLLSEDTDIRDHLPHFVELVVERNAEDIIELGVRGGVSTVAWLHGLQQTGGTLWSVDLHPAPQLPSANWRFLCGDDLLVANQLPDHVDIVFIDTSHTYAQTLAELDLYVPKVRPGGVVLLHDTELEHPEESPPTDPPFPVKTAVADFCTMHDFEWTNNPVCWGLATISVPEEVP